MGPSSGRGDCSPGTSSGCHLGARCPSHHRSNAAVTCSTWLALTCGRTLRPHTRCPETSGCNAPWLRPRARARRTAADQRRPPGISRTSDSSRFQTPGSVHPSFGRRRVTKCPTVGLTVGSEASQEASRRRGRIAQTAPRTMTAPMNQAPSIAAAARATLFESLSWRSDDVILVARPSASHRAPAPVVIPAPLHVVVLASHAEPRPRRCRASYRSSGASSEVPARAAQARGSRAVPQVGRRPSAGSSSGC
jgi:hypothetical protein